MKTIHLITIYLVSFTLISCGGSVIKSTSENQTVTNNLSVQLSDEQMSVITIATSKVEKLNMAYTVETNGTLELPPQNEATISSLINGRVRQIHVVQGDAVKKGQTVVTLENPDFIDLQKEYLTLKNQVDYLKQEYDRAKLLRESEINSVKTFSKIESDYKEVLHQFNAAKSQLELYGVDFKKLDQGDFQSLIFVRSPIDGFVGAVNIKMGEFVEASTNLLDVTDNSHLHLELLVYEKDLTKIDVGQNVHFYTSSNSEKIYQAKVFAIGKSFENDQKAIKVYADIMGQKDYLIPGMYVNGHIELDSNVTNVLPREAVFEEGGLYYVFYKIPNQENTFQKLEVIPGAFEGDKQEIIFFQPEDAQKEFVVKGAYYLNAELNKTAE